MTGVERTALYRLFNAKDQLLYVGIAADPAARWKGHCHTKPWVGEVAMRVIEWFSTHDEALRAETEAIRFEYPRYNISQSQRSDKPKPPRPSMKFLAREDLDSAKDYLAIQDVAALLGVGPKVVSVYRYYSKPGHLYADDPFPAQDCTIARHPVWHVSRRDELQDWRARHCRRPGQGAGGGRPRKTES